MTTTQSAPSEQSSAAVEPVSAVQALEQDPRWLRASESERAVLRRIAEQRDRWARQRSERVQARALAQTQTAIRPDAPFAERLMSFVRLHPVATAVVAGAALMVGPRRLIRYGAWALPLIRRLKR